jgi:hypothetical protein
LRIIYRSYGGENAKERPPYYSKQLALQSMLTAATAAQAEIVFINDGPVAAPLLDLMQASGDVVTLDSVGMRGSYLAALRYPRQHGWQDDLVWFSEDDYLYRPEAFVALEAAAARSSADYFALYGGTAHFPVHSGLPEDGWLPDGWDAGVPLEVDGQRWERIVSTTSSFGARTRALRQDMSIFLQGLLPHRHSLRDHDTCVVYQGYAPHRWSRLAQDLRGHTPGPAIARLTQAGLVPFKAALNLRAHRRPPNRRVLLAAAPNLATHMESEWMAPGRDWAALAAATVQAWSDTGGRPAGTDPS